jgi:hypothetical protein
MTRHNRNLSKRQTLAATKIQAVFRGHMRRQWLEVNHVAAIRIQALFRGFAARSKLQHQTRFQTDKNHINAQLVQTQRKINALEKEMQSLSLASRTRVWEAERKDRAARTIQKHVREYLLRKNISRPSSPAKSIHDQTMEEEETRQMERVVMKMRDDDDPDLLRRTVSSIQRRVLNDQFRQTICMLH